MDINYLKDNHPSLYADLYHRMGGIDYYEDSQEVSDPIDEEISKLTPKEALREWVGWTLGDPLWANIILDNYEIFKKVHKNE